METQQDEIIEISIATVDQLYDAYLPFLKNGGLTISTLKASEMGASHTIRLQLLSENDPLLFQGKVVWITPPGSHLPTHNGIGVEFIGESAKETRKKIELHLAGKLKGD